MSVFNANNTEWKSGNYKMFFGEAPALHDSINRPYPAIFELYKAQKAQDWSEEEVNLSQDRMDFLSSSTSNYDVMINTLAYQWELDSVASRAIAPLFAPFTSNSEVWAWLCKVTEIEVLHALTYSEIVRQAIPKAQEAISLAMENMNILERSTKVVEVFDNLAKVGAKVTLGEITVDNAEAKRAVILAMVALYALERIEFMASFAATFALAELGIFQGIAKLVAKILADEQLHYTGDEYILRVLQKEEPEVYQTCLTEIKDILDSVTRAELEWNTYIFSEGRTIVGLNKLLLDEWVLFNSKDAYTLCQVPFDFPDITENPLPWMAHWMDLDLVQTAPQESDTVNYLLNSVIDDAGDDELDF